MTGVQGQRQTSGGRVRLGGGAGRAGDGPGVPWWGWMLRLDQASAGVPARDWLHPTASSVR